MEIFWKHKSLFKGLVIMMGGFHLLMMLLGIIGTRFGDAGLRELAVQSEVVAEGSIDKVLSGKQYNRAVRLHKLTYEALMRLLLKEFESSVELSTPLDLEQLKLDPNQEEFARVLHSDNFREWENQFTAFVQGIQKSGTDLARFWLTYLDLCELLLNLIYATRTGKWDLYLVCIEEVINWAFAYDRQNYARYLIPFLNDMRSLSTTMPEVHAAFSNGQFSVQMGKRNPFGRNEADKTIENTINRDCKTSSGYIGFSANFPATQRWVLNDTRRAVYSKLLRDHLSLATNKAYVHNELTAGRIKADVRGVNKLVDLLGEVFSNPLKNNAEFTSLSTGIAVTAEVRDDLLQAREKGQKEAKEFVLTRSSSVAVKNFYDPMKKVKLKSFKNLKTTVKVHAKAKVIPLQMDRSLFARMALLS